MRSTFFFKGAVKFSKAASTNCYLNVVLTCTVARYNGAHLYVESLPPYNLNTV